MNLKLFIYNLYGVIILEIYTISGYDLYEYIMSGAKNIITQEDVLNKINVFPIADNDTGSNLSFTMKCIVAKSEKHSSVSKTLESISRVASEDSFGNSGTIFASYLYGLSQETNQRSTADSLSTEEFANIANAATNYAYDSIAMPIEGTMLTIMREWSQFLVQNHSDSRDMRSLLSRALHHAHTVLEKTMYQIAELRESKVVDAGALGFVYFLEGILDVIENDVVKPTSKYVKDFLHMVSSEKSLKYRYCSEFLYINTHTKITNDCSEILSDFCDSIVIQEQIEYTKVHCHTNNPAQVAKCLTQYGEIIKSKVDDMLIQTKIVNNVKQRIGILTDTIADLPDKLIIDHLIVRLPIQLIIGKNTYLDRLTISPETLLDLAKTQNSYPTSGQPGELFIKKTIRYMLNHFDHVIGIFVSSKMSGLYQKIEAVAMSQNYSNFHLIDSKCNSAIQGLMVAQIASDIDHGLSIHDIVTHLEADRSKFKIFVEIPDLSYATKSGRVPKIVGNIAQLLKLNAVISINSDGKGIITKERSLDQVTHKIIAGKSIDKYVIVHSGDLDRAQAYADQVTKLTGTQPLYIAEVSSVVSAFVGRGSVGIGFKEK